MSLFKMPMAVRERLDRIHRNFLWEAQNARKKLHLMKWCDAIKPISAGGIGLATLELTTWALLTKWWWRFEEEKNALLRKVVVSKYGEDDWTLVKFLDIGCLVCGVVS